MTSVSWSGVGIVVVGKLFFVLLRIPFVRCYVMRLPLGVIVIGDYGEVGPGVVIAGVGSGIVAVVDPTLAD